MFVTFSSAGSIEALINQEQPAPPGVWRKSRFGNKVRGLSVGESFIQPTYSSLSSKYEISFPLSKRHTYDSKHDTGRDIISQLVMFTSFPPS
jgi:hypothetical protein